MSMREAFNKAGFKDVRKNQENNFLGESEHSKQSEPKNNPPKIVFRDDRQLRRELLTSDAEKWANFLYDNKNGVTATQLRSFFNEVKALQSRIEAGGFTANDAIIGLLKSKAAYALVRAEKRRKKGFKYLKNMIEQCVDLSKNEEAFNDFVLFFEAVMGFFRWR